MVGVPSEPRRSRGCSAVGVAKWRKYRGPTDLRPANCGRGKQRKPVLKARGTVRGTMEAIEILKMLQPSDLKWYE